MWFWICKGFYKTSFSCFSSSIIIEDIESLLPRPGLILLKPNFILFLSAVLSMILPLTVDLFKDYSRLLVPGDLPGVPTISGLSLELESFFYF